MQKTPKSLRLQIGIFGRTNVGKSSFLNMICGQNVAITSSIAGTTTDIVEKAIELLPFGPVVLLDTAGIDDMSSLAFLRIEKTKKIFLRADLIVLITEANIFTHYEKQLIQKAKKNNLPIITIVNKIDQKMPNLSFLKKLPNYMLCSCVDLKKKEKHINIFKNWIIKLMPNSFFASSIVHNLIKPHGLAILIIPIDLEAPKGRLILPQVQTIRDLLDKDAAALIVKENDYQKILSKLATLPDLVICDSQVVDKMVKETPLNVKCTTFSILFSRLKGSLQEAIEGVKTIDRLEHKDKILIAEACSHHPLEDDIGRKKIPKWLREYTGLDLQINVCAGRDYPENLEQYKLIIHCGGCMLTKKEMIFRMQQAVLQNIAITNYGVCISFLKGVLQRVIDPILGGLNV